MTDSKQPGAVPLNTRFEQGVDPASTDHLPLEVAFPGIPAKISGLKVRMWLRMLGLPLDDLKSFTLDHGGIAAELYAKDSAGRRYVGDLNADEVATHRIRIEVDWNAS